MVALSKNAPHMLRITSSKKRFVEKEWIMVLTS
jgi:hypothetical protein